MRNRIAIIAAALCLNFVPLSQANTILSENFDNVAGLAGGGWAVVNNSAPLGSTNWFQGNDGVFPAYSGSPNSYIAANYVNAGLSGNISDWLITPELSLSGLIEITFFTRTDTGSEFPDRLQLRFSSNGASTNVGANAARPNAHRRRYRGVFALGG